MKVFGNIVCALVSGLVLAGCVTEAPIQKKITDARINLVNSDEFSMELLASTTKIDDFGLLTVDASLILSRTPPLAWMWGGDPKIEVGYRFQWIDGKGKTVDSAKRTISALPGNIVSIHGVAPSEKDVSFKLTVFLNGQEAKPAPKVEAGAKPGAKPVSKKEAKPAVKPVAVPAPKAEAKPVAKPAPKAETKPAAKPAPKAEAKTVAKPSPKAEAKPVAKPAPKAETKPVAKPAQLKLTEPFE